MSRAKSTAARCDAAFARIVTLARKYGLPPWATLKEADAGLQQIAPGEGNQTYRSKLKGAEVDQLRNDLHVYNETLGKLPWHHAGRVKEREPRAPKKAPPKLAPPEPEA